MKNVAAEARRKNILIPSLDDNIQFGNPLLRLHQGSGINVRFDKAFFCRADYAGPQLLSGDVISYHLTESEAREYISMYTNEDSMIVWLNVCSESRVYRVSDFLSSEKQRAIPVYVTFLEKYKVWYSLRITLIHQDKAESL